MSDETLGAYNIADLREIARRRLPKGMFEFVDRGTEDELALANNRAGFDRIKFRPRTLVDVSKRTQAIELFGKKQALPIVVGPTGTAGLMWFDGEIAIARAAAAAGIPYTIATNSLRSMEAIAEKAGGTLWFQLYMWPERRLSHELVERARAIGCEALLVTVDGVVGANREYNKRNGFHFPFRYTARNVIDVSSKPGWLFGVFLRHVAAMGMPRFEDYPREIADKITSKTLRKSELKTESLSWEDVKALRKVWRGRLIVKGVQHPQDAVIAAECGCDGVIVSNHGGRNLDSSMAPIDVLPEVLDAAGKRLTVMMDSGVRRGSDVVKALALGAEAVLLGRATLYGTAAGGEAGAARAIAIFREEIDRVMALLGANSVAELGLEYLHFADRAPPRGGTVSEVRRATVAA